jgi:PAS domain S-box-containing protein
MLLPEPVERPHHERVERALVASRTMRSNTGRTLAALAFSSYSATSSSKLAELELAETSSLLEAVLESVSEVSVIAGDPALTITVFNRGAERLLGYSAAELVGIATPSVFHYPAEVEERAMELTAALGRTVQGGEVFTAPETLGQSREWTYVRKDGTRVAVALVVTAMRGDAGELLGYVGVAHDMSRQKEREQALVEARQRAEQASLAKSQFLANMSHEIRTPMNAVIGFSYLLEQTSLDAQQADHLKKIKLASKSLLGVINDILDLSKIEAGELSLERAPFNLLSVISDVAAVMRVQSEAKHIGFELDARVALPGLIEGDAHRLNQILTNLLSNAIKFTSRGAVGLTVRQRAAASDRVNLRFEVRDTGIGISADGLARLFRPFSQADSSTTRRFGGTGLGLSIVRQLVELMDGRVGVDSTPGVGSEFWVELGFGWSEDLTTCAPEPSIVAGEQALAGVRVLVVDDSHVNIEVARRILELSGANVSTACDGREAVEYLRAQPQAYDVVLMDVQMPVLDGLAATRMIRDELGLRELPIIALTAGALSTQRAAASDAGMRDFISKPFEPGTVVHSVYRHARRRGEAAAIAVLPAPTLRPNRPNDGPWHEVDGIVTEEVRARLGGDLELFRSLLAHLLDEFIELPVPAATASTAALAALARQVHKLRGGAGNVGANQLLATCAEAEAACKRGDREQAQQLAQRVNELLGNLRRAAAAWVSERPPQRTGRIPVIASTHDDLSKLLSLLRQQHIAALDQFEVVASSLRGRLGDERYARVRSLIENLQFSDAVGELSVEGVG